MNRIMIAAAVGSLLLVGQPAFAQRIMTEGIKELATQIATDAVKERKGKIAVVPFYQLNSQSMSLGVYISEELITDLVAVEGIKIVERSMLDKLIGEFRLSQTGLIDPNTAKKIGKLAGADAIVTGTIADLQTYMVINCRLIDSQTGNVFAAAQTRIIKDANLQNIIGEAGNQKKPPSFKQN
jgi:TolB-like protein